MSDDIFREIDEELRQEKAFKFWKQYHKHIMGVALAILVVTASVVGWRSYQRSVYEAQSDKFLEILADQKGNSASRIAALKEFSAEDRTVYSVLARFVLATVYAHDQKFDEAGKVYEEIVNHKQSDQILSDMARYLEVLVKMNQADPAQLRKDLEPLMAKSNSWRYGAMELSALIDLREGKSDKAKEVFGQLAADENAPVGVRQRAGTILSVLKRS